LVQAAWRLRMGSLKIAPLRCPTCVRVTATQCALGLVEGPQRTRATSGQDASRDGASICLATYCRVVAASLAQ
jgi:hypothetical protein